MTPTDTIAPQKAKQIHATALGAPRIGPNRELKKAVEDYWSGSLDARALEEVAAGLRRDTRAGMMRAGFDSVPTNTFSYYDQMLDTAVLLGALPRHGYWTSRTRSTATSSRHAVPRVSVHSR